MAHLRSHPGGHGTPVETIPLPEKLVGVAAFTDPDRLKAYNEAHPVEEDEAEDGEEGEEGTESKPATAEDWPLKTMSPKEYLESGKQKHAEMAVELVNAGLGNIKKGE